MSLAFPTGMEIELGGSVTMTKCTSTGQKIFVRPGASLVMEDSRIFGVRGQHGSATVGGSGVACQGETLHL